MDARRLDALAADEGGVLVGASGWEYLVEGADPETALLKISEQVLANRAFYLYWEDDERFEGAPSNLDDLQAVKERDEFWEVGTHSILDMDHLIGPEDDDDDGSLRLLPDELVREIFGRPDPAVTDFERASSDLPAPRRWSGFYLPLTSGGKTSHVAFWGSSGD